jgi:hypothetical protein
MEKKELSGLARQLLQSSGAQTFFTQAEFDDALVIAKAEIMQVAIETSKQAIFIERQACADMVAEAGHDELAEAIRNRMQSQRVQ